MTKGYFVHDAILDITYDKKNFEKITIGDFVDSHIKDGESKRQHIDGPYIRTVNGLTKIIGVVRERNKWRNLFYACLYHSFFNSLCTPLSTIEQRYLLEDINGKRILKSIEEIKSEYLEKSFEEQFLTYDERQDKILLEPLTWGLNEEKTKGMIYNIEVESHYHVYLINDVFVEDFRIED